MFATEESVSSASNQTLSEIPGASYRSPPYVFKSESNQGSIAPFHQFHNVIITPVVSPSSVPLPQPTSSPLTIDSLAVVSTSDSAKYNSSSVRSPSSPGACVLKSSLPPAPLLTSGCTLTPRTDPSGCDESGITLLGNKYILLDQLEGSNLRRCIDIKTKESYVCKVVNHDSPGRGMLAAHYRVDGHPNINPIHEVVVGENQTYLFFPPCFTDLHSYVRTRRRLREPQARPLFRQIVLAVHEAHSKGIVLRDLKLRKFVFADESRTELKLESLEDAIVLDEPDHDLLSDKHGCPAYVSPEILTSHSQYSGRAADMWGLGVMLYTMLVGRYPFHGQEHSGLFAKIRRGTFSLPDSLSSRAKCLIRCLLRKEPDERLTTEDVLIHPWMIQQRTRERYRRSVTTAAVTTSLTSSWSSSNPTSLLTQQQPSTAVGAGISSVCNENSDQIVPDCNTSDFLDVDKS